MGAHRRLTRPRLLSSDVGGNSSNDFGILDLCFEVSFPVNLVLKCGLVGFRSVVPMVDPQELAVRYWVRTGPLNHAVLVSAGCHRETGKLSGVVWETK